MGNPHQLLNFIHVAGTNGKGSTSSFLHSILLSEGYRVGLFTSPHLHCYTDRIRINGINIPQEEFAEILTLLSDPVNRLIQQYAIYPAMFDLMTLIAFIYFSRKQLDYVVLEVGLGGLTDATNVIEDSLASVITPIAVDHVDVLGSDIRGIAHHKAGIIKENNIVVSHWQIPEVQEVIQEVATKQNAILQCFEERAISITHQDYLEQCFDFRGPYGEMKNLKIRMIGEHQINNACVAILTLLTLRHHNLIELSDEAIYKGLYLNSWPGRLELMNESPLLFIDGAHNLQGAEVLASAIKKFFSSKKINFVIGMLSNKDVSGVLNHLIPLCSRVIFTRPNNPKAMDPTQLASQVNYFGKEVYSCETIEDAIKLTLQLNPTQEEVTIFTGSLYLIGDVRKALLQHIETDEIAS